MLTPIAPLSLQFTSDGTSTALQVDLSVAPVSINFAGQEPIGFLKPVVTFNGGTLNTSGATLEGTVLTVTFPVAPPQLDANQNLIVYTLTGLIQFAE